jgi:hypothetical protein
MGRHRTFALLVIGFLILVLGVSSGQDQNIDQTDHTSATALHVGDPLPQLSGQTLTTKVLELPAAAAGQRAVVVFSFSRTAGKDARLWNEHTSRDFPDAVPHFTVIVLESVPKLIRSMAVSGIKSSMPVPAQDRTIILYRDEKLWKLRLSVADSDRAYVLLLGPDGHIRWSNSAAFADSEYAQLKKEIAKMLQPPSSR